MSGGPLFRLPSKLKLTPVGLRHPKYREYLNCLVVIKALGKLVRPSSRKTIEGKSFWAKYLRKIQEMMWIAHALKTHLLKKYKSGLSRSSNLKKRPKTGTRSRIVRRRSSRY